MYVNSCKEARNLSAHTCVPLDCSDSRILGLAIKWSTVVRVGCSIFSVLLTYTWWWGPQTCHTDKKTTSVLKGNLYQIKSYLALWTGGFAWNMWVYLHFIWLSVLLRACISPIWVNFPVNCYVYTAPVSCYSQLISLGSKSDIYRTFLSHLQAYKVWESVDYIVEKKSL